MSNQTVESVLSSLGYSTPLDAARQQARMVLLGRLARYQANIQQIESKHEASFEELSQGYHAQDSEDWQKDDDFLEWQWYHDAIESVKSQLSILDLPVAK